VQPEREALESLIYEMYQTWGRALGIMFELVRWETHVTPAFGSDPQAVINSQIGDNYDVFIGILWARFGTPTPRAASGTMEEFERAYARVQAGANNPEIMFYFKEAAVPISKIDPEQLKKVQNFRGSLRKKAVFTQLSKTCRAFPPLFACICHPWRRSFLETMRRYHRWTRRNRGKR
jgi:hypothetical protein